MSKMNEQIAREIIDRLKERRRERLYAAYREAASDPAHVSEMSELNADFECTVADGLD